MHECYFKKCFAGNMFGMNHVASPCRKVAGMMLRIGEITFQMAEGFRHYSDFEIILVTSSVRMLQ